MKKTFRAHDGRKVPLFVSDEQRAETEILNMTAIIMPILMIVVFAAVSGLI